MALLLEESLECPIPFDRNDVQGSLDKEWEWLQAQGDVLQFQYADGYAYYLVVKRRPLTLQHIAIGDAWQLPWHQIEDMSLRTVEAKLEEQRKFYALFNK